MIMDNKFAYRELLGQDEGSSFGAVTINVASPDVVRSWSHGEVKNPETINYRSFKPEKGGLFCERIFGPTRDWECNCGKYKRVKHKGVVCDRCGVEVTQSRVRRERMGHIELAVPVTHIWFFKCMPSRIGLMLDMTARALERVVYYEDWVVTDPGDTPLQMGQSLNELEYQQAREEYGETAFQADMGAPAIRTLLEKTDMAVLREDLDAKMQATRSKAIRKKLAKRMRLVEGFVNSNSRPEWMILEVLPVLPPDLRPLVPLEGGRFATSDLNDLYRRVINRNNRLKNLLQLRTPEVIIRNEKRMLQEAVDALMDNGRHGRTVTGAGNRPLKSLSDMLKGKSGRFRQNLLGKRVDYSGRSVIVVGPELRLDQCGLPKKMALVLFEPFIIRHLKERGHVHTVRSAKRMIEQGEPIVWDILEEVIQGHPVMLNRAPTLHRLSIQAFNPVLIEGSAIRIHPLVCAAYNADFDGDQMAVHVPLSNEAQIETKLIMLAPNNIFSPSSGKPIMSPTQDITLGSYYLNAEPNPALKPRTFAGYFDALNALGAGVIEIHDPIMIPNPDRNRKTLWGNPEAKMLATTPGRCIFNEIWPSELGFHNSPTDKKALGRLISDCYKHVGHEATIRILDQLKELGYEYATRAGFSISITDMVIPPSKDEHIARAREEIKVVVQQHTRGVLTDGERHNKICDIWTQASNRVANDLFTTLNQPLQRRSEMNPIFAMLDSGARGSRDQIRQLAGMRGLMSKPSGDIIERPIISNFREGLSVLEYFISTHGARKGLADTALKTADSGYMTRKLVDVAQDLICREEDCGTVKGIWVSNIIEGDDEVVSIRERVVGRYSAQSIRDPLHEGEYLVRASEEITEPVADALVDRGINRVFIRSVLTCETRSGTCIKCYGRNLANDRPAVIGDALGIIAAQSIGEPGTQLTMRTFHIGGTATSAYKQPLIQARQGGTIKFENVRVVENEAGETIVVNKNGTIVIYDADRLDEAKARVAEFEKALAEAERKGNAEKAASLQESLVQARARTHYSHYELDRFEIERGAIVARKDGSKVKPNDKIISWDPYNVPIIAEEAGTIVFRDLIEGVTLNRETKRGGVVEVSVMEHREDLHPQIVINDAQGEMIAHYPLPSGAHLMIAQNAKAKAGTVLARVPRQLAKNKDITGGLPRVSELFEARTPREVAEIARIDGVVELGKITRGRRQVIIRDLENNQTEEHTIPATKHLSVGKGDVVRKGQKLTEGAILPQELLDICGPQELQEYLVNEIQLVYRAQGVEINDKHIEVIVRQMLQKVRITDPGTTLFLPAEEIDRQAFLDENARVVTTGGQPAQAEPVLLGITKASLETESFISAASFQDTTRVLTEAATLGKTDFLRGFKENVITGHLIPAGTGTEEIQGYRIVRLGEELAPDRDLDVREEATRLTIEEKANLAAAREMLAIDDD
jgi:DNA-directed RNA polymerase subunit beta'